MIERGALRHYWRPGRTDPTNAVFVRRSEVEQMQQAQRDHEVPESVPELDDYV
jgi:hypothetical protein